MAAPARIVLGVSACLAGEAVRWDGGHRAAWFPQGELPTWVRLRPMCPEAVIGLGVPRPPIRLEAGPAGPTVRRFGPDADGVDLGPRLQDFARRVAADGGLDGFVLAPGSPSCGLQGVPVHASASPQDRAPSTSLVPPAQGAPDRHAAAPGSIVADGAGAFAAGLAALRPDLPRIEGPQLFDRARRRAFLERVRIGAWWRGPGLRDVRLERLRAILRSRGAHAEALLRRQPAPETLDALLAGPVTSTDLAAALALLGQTPDGVAARVLAGELDLVAARAICADARVFDDPIFWACT